MIKAGTVVDFSLCMEAHRGSYRGIELRHKGDLNPAMCKLSKSVEIVSSHHVIQFTSAGGGRVRNGLPVCPRAVRLGPFTFPCGRSARSCLHPLPPFLLLLPVLSVCVDSFHEKIHIAPLPSSVLSVLHLLACSRSPMSVVPSDAPWYELWFPLQSQRP